MSLQGGAGDADPNAAISRLPGRGQRYEGGDLMPRGGGDSAC